MEDYFIRSVCFQNILSFDHFELTDFKRINVFIGGNSSGKSNIIRATIGFVHDKNSNSVGHICFADGTDIDQPLVKSKYCNLYFEIPPFRNLIMPEGCALDRVNWRSGIIDLSKISKKREATFYEDLEKIIGIEGFRLRSRRGLPVISYNGHRLNAEEWTNWGYYYRKIESRAEEIPIDYLGWGTKSAIIIYYNLFFNEEAIVFIEEPEISMHPELLKKLFMWAFHSRPRCQFFITTHSSMLIDKVFLGESENLSLYEIYSEGSKTRKRSLNKKLDQLRLLEEMGFQSSNLLFANYLIWVEGPSDIFYYEALLNIMDKIKGGKGMKRGVHYELMWYGGRQVKNMIDIESDDGLNLLLSFGRRGAIFWDYDDKRRYAEELANRVKEFKKNLEISSGFSRDFCFGITGEMMSENGGNLSKDNYPWTVENLMSEEFATHALKKAFPKTEKQKLEKLAKTFGINCKPKNDFDKKALGIAFLKIINSKLGRKKLQNVFRSVIAHERYETIRAFFDKLYEKILDANGVKR